MLQYCFEGPPDVSILDSLATSRTSPHSQALESAPILWNVVDARSRTSPLTVSLEHEAPKNMISAPNSDGSLPARLSSTIYETDSLHIHEQTSVVHETCSQPVGSANIGDTDGFQLLPDVTVAGHQMGGCQNVASRHISNEASLSDNIFTDQSNLENSAALAGIESYTCAQVETMGELEYVSPSSYVAGSWDSSRQDHDLRTGGVTEGSDDLLGFFHEFESTANALDVFNSTSEQALEALSADTNWISRFDASHVATTGQDTQADEDSTKINSHEAHHSSYRCPYVTEDVDDDIPKQGQPRKRRREPEKEADVTRGTSSKRAKKAKTNATIFTTANPLGSNTLESNLVDDAAAMQDVASQPRYEGTTLRATALEQLTKGVDGKRNKNMASDKKCLDEACKAFGRNQIRPDPQGGSNWLVRGMKSTLKPHQVIGTGFMLSQESRASEPRGGVLADQMGLGKTVMTLALINNKATQRRQDSGPTLIVAPASVVRQWYDEITKHCVTEKGKYAVGKYKIFKSSIEKKKANPILGLQETSIIITSYWELTDSFPDADPPQDIKDPFERQAWQDLYFAQNKGILHRMKFRRIVLDEAHLVRNPKTRAYRAAKALAAEHFWSLTGTPFVNHIADLWTLLNLSRAPLERTYPEFRADYSVTPGRKALKGFADLASTCLLRRTHRSLLFNAKLVTLPKTSSSLLKVDFSTIERTIYDLVEASFRKKVIKILSDEEASTRDQEPAKRGDVLTMLLRLRQLTAHPLVLQDELLNMLEREDLIALEDVVRKEQKSLRKQGIALIKRLRDTLSKNFRQAAYVDRVVVHGPNSQELSRDMSQQRFSDIKTGGNFGLRQHFDRYVAQLLQKKDQSAIDQTRKCVDCKRMPRDPWVTRCLHVYCATCLESAQHEAAEDDSIAACRGCGEHFGYAEPCDDSALRQSMEKKEKAKKPKKNPLEVDIADLMGADGQILPSAKTIAVKSKVLEILKQDQEAKIIVFTQWLLMLRILELICDSEGWKAIFYHGQMGQNARTEAVKRFGEEPDARILLCSLHAGGVGLNLTMASKVICLDHWWNNAIEEQAFARCYRIGQTKETQLLQLYVNDTIDDRMEKIKAKKQVLINNVHGGDSQFFGNLTKKDILSLFGGAKQNDDGPIDAAEELGGAEGQEEGMMLDSDLEAEGHA